MAKKPSNPPPGEATPKDAAKVASRPRKSRKPVRPSYPTAIPQRPGYGVYGSTVQTPAGRILIPGLYWHGIRDEAETDTFICSPLEAIAITSDSDGGSYGRLLRFMTPDGDWREWAAPMHMLAGGGDELRAELLSQGVTIANSQRGKLADYIMQSTPKRRATAAIRTGWHGSALFVMPRQVIGAGDVIFQSEQAAIHEYAEAGTLDGWQAHIGARCLGNPVLLLAVCASLAGPLLTPLDAAGGGFHLVGDSSSGKSIALYAAASVWGKPGDFLRTWNATGNGLEGVAALRNDTALILDEIGEADAREIGKTVYALGNGTGKQRAGRTGAARGVHKWRVMMLSSGEMTLGKHMESAGAHSKAGQELRLLDVPAYRRFGAYDDLHGQGIEHDPQRPDSRRGAGRAFADTLKRATTKHYGHLGPAFIRLLVGVRQNDPQADTMLESLVDTLLQRFNVDSGQEARAAARFAVAALAGELASQAGLVPWPEGVALAAALELFEAWRNFRGRGQSEDGKILRAIAAFIERHGARFEGFATADALPVRDRAGWYRDEAGIRHYLFTEAALQEAASGFDRRRILAALDGAEALERGDGKNLAKRIRIPGHGLARLYVINPAALLTVDESVPGSA